VAPTGGGGEPIRGRRPHRPRPDLARPRPVPISFEPEPAAEDDVEAGPAENDPMGPPDAAGGSLGPGEGGVGITLGRHGRPRELVARVVGAGSELAGVGDAPTVSLKEATSLRVRDYFPRLPAASWPEARPYIVRVALCVSEAGSVTDAVLQSSASSTLDPLVLAAVRSWRYRPRLIDGTPHRFCHAVTIAYERAY
jgi:TonB family protein